ncbi:polysaccharide biosynthesis/export family protein [Rufibacter roseolus]|uniref:polysaccharide biosynthesis/export family protein n=1 Tax=Rufibacter roseolus TaxID=2817375 RepID=UPI001B31026D|nr:polysaccharide biosynthesis/export family protein [Rufibacter roseolus]
MEVNIRLRKIKKYLFIYTILLLLITSCSPSKNLVYFEDLKNISSTETNTDISNANEPKIQSGDILGITVSSLNPESNILFNGGSLVTPGMTSDGVRTTVSTEGYLVEENGEINFPVLGKVRLAGLTKAEATLRMTDEIKKHVKNPIVNIRFINFKYTVLGEVNKPSTYIAPTQKVNIIEALGQAGDMTIYGKRENVLIIRERDGVRSTARLDLTKKEALNSPYYYLQQNDIVYVEPSKARDAQLSNTRSNISIGLSIISLISIIITRLI